MMLQPQPLSGSSRHLCVSFLPALHSSATQSLEQSLFTVMVVKSLSHV